MVGVKSGNRPGMFFVFDGLGPSHTGLVPPDKGPHELVILHEVAALTGHMVVAVAHTALSAALHEGAVCLILITRRRRRDLTYYMCP